MPYTDKLNEAFLFAAAKHRDQTRKGTAVPYLTHLMAVAALVGEYGGDEEQVMAALLHDSIEDQGVTREELRGRFGGRVTQIVSECSDSDTIPKPPWRERKERYVAHLRQASPDVRLVSVADKLHNARSIVSDLRVSGPDTWSKFNAGPDEILWYYRSLIEALANGWSHPLIDELKRTVSEMERLKAGPAA